MIEKDFDIPFIPDLSLREKQVRRNYRPVAAVHKVFARRLGFRCEAQRDEEDADCNAGQGVYCGTSSSEGGSYPPEGLRLKDVIRAQSRRL
jgi:hypothetical protein